jgi:hypothetical protein
VVGVDEAGEDDVPAQIEDLIGPVWKRIGRSDGLDKTIAGEQPTVLDFPPLAIHRDEEIGVLD